MLRKMSKIKLDLESLENEIIEKMAVHFVPDAESLPSTPVRPQKRATVEVCTPIRDILSRTVAAETPIVSVRIIVI